MAEKYFKYMVGAFFLLAGASMCVALVGPSSSTRTVDAEKGLDLTAVGELLERAEDAKSLERLLNDPETGANNLDLNADGKVDFIKVTEFGSGDVRGFSLSTEVAPNQEQEIATIKIQKEPDESADVQMQGNSTIYGNNQYYHTRWSPGFGSGLLLGYLFSSHRPYSGGWGYGSYPGYYRPYPSVPNSRYRTRWSGTNRYTRSDRPRFGESVRSPVQGRNATQVKARLRNPTTSQRSFQSRQARASRSGGFGQSVRRNSYSRGSRSFGK